MTTHYCPTLPWLTVTRIEFVDYHSSYEGPLQACLLSTQTSPWTMSWSTHLQLAHLWKRTKASQLPSPPYHRYTGT